MCAVSGVDIWFINSTSYLPAQSGLSVWLSPSPTYSATGSLECVSNFSPTVFAPAKQRIACAETLNATRYVTVWRPITAAASSLYIYEMRVVRTGVVGARDAPRLRNGHALQGLCKLHAGPLLARLWLLER